ncbi:hypothetical protein EZJ19_02545 [Parasulfuritortus cantonensis]|uniref:Uncharacterized protein n=2 Tax=Parasulfuritortus cantonensis TaxID=2528202 RepID=A0A4R1BLT3_9PROT|nr:hypothetical protein EZJ19_02545 [Parasulfuritortus cantonensis]
MPQFLRTSSVRLLEASQEALNLALHSLGMPTREELRVDCAQFAAPTGLIGAAAEQCMAAILVQVLGEEALMSYPNQFKSAREVLREVRALLRAPVPRASFLTVGVADAAAHRTSLYRATEGFALLIGERAASLHAGKGPSRAVAMVQAQKVLDFFSLLASSPRVRPYLERLPRPSEARVDQELLVDQLARRFMGAETLADRSQALRSLYLVLPEVPEEAPDWLDAFDRSAVAPTTEDINLLLQTLERAAPVRFQRLNAGGQGLPVVVRQQDPNALPIAAHHLRRAFGNILDQFDADVGTANGRLDAGTLDVPPESFLLDLCVLGPIQLCQSIGRQTLTAHEVWPFVATALAQQGTQRPFWFLVSRVDDLGQLIGQLRRAFAVSRRAQFRQQEAPTIEALEALRNARQLTAQSELAEFARTAYAAAGVSKEALAVAIERNQGTERESGPEAGVILRQVSVGAQNAGLAYEAIMAINNIRGKRYWARLLAEASTDPEDRGMLVQILRNPDLASAQTAARRALKLIDAIAYGPQIELE